MSGRRLRLKPGSMRFESRRTPRNSAVANMVRHSGENAATSAGTCSAARIWRCARSSRSNAARSRRMTRRSREPARSPSCSGSAVHSTSTCTSTASFRTASRRRQTSHPDSSRFGARPRTRSGTCCSGVAGRVRKLLRSRTEATDCDTRGSHTNPETIEQPATPQQEGAFVAAQQAACLRSRGMKRQVRGTPPAPR
jgi:hypothetical protein